MELIAKLKIDNLFKSKDYKDSKSGDITPGKWKIQTFQNIESEEGNQMKLIDISIPDELALKLQGKIGEVVNVPVGTFINNNKVGFYGL